MELNLPVVLLILSLLAILTYVVSQFYTIGIVQGNSMLPTFHPWGLVLIRKGNKLESGKCYIFQREGIAVIKRLTEIRVDEVNGKIHLWMEGDNAEDSIDSRDYGYVGIDVLIGEVVEFGGIKNERNDHT